MRLKYRNYIGEFDYVKEHDIYAGKIIGITDLVTFESYTSLGIVNSFHSSVDDYIDTINQIKK